jgi:hypothetical protein
LVLTLAFAGLVTDASAQFLKVGPVIFNSSVNNSWSLSSNVNGISKKEAAERGLDREDFWTTYGISLSGNSIVYPDIDLSVSSSVNWEEHFIQDRPPSDPNLPLLGNSAFSLSRSLGHYSWSMNLGHSANTTRDKTTVPIFVPGDELLVRDILQSSNAGTRLGWSRRDININSNYSFTKSQHSEEFKKGNSESQSYGVNLGYTPWQRFSVNYGFSSSKNDLTDADPPVQGDWLESQSLTASYRILERPQLTYSVGFEKEDDRIIIGKWEPVHSWALSDSRSMTETISYSVNATYSLDENPEEDDINFLYGASLSHEMTRSVRHSLNLTRTPVETFGSTVTTDSTSLGYNMNINSPLIRGGSLSFGANYSRNEPRGEVAGPIEERTDYTASYSKSAPIPLNRKLTGNVSYSYQYNLPDQRDAYDVHSLVLTLSYSL